MTPLSLAETKEYLEKDPNKKEIVKFIKKFSPIDAKKAKELREEIRKLGLFKIKEEHISKIIDLLPETKEELNKIHLDVDLSEDEKDKLLETIKKFK